MRRTSTASPVPPEEWIAIPVPAIIDPDLFAAAQEQLDENRQRKREGRRRPGWLLQGVVLCRQCGYAFYGKMARGLVGGQRPADYGYYRCTGTDAHRFGGQAICHNRSVRSDKLEEALWHQVKAVLADPQRVAAEHERRAAAARDGHVHQDVDGLERQMTRLRRGMDRLINGYAEDVIDADEFKPRLTRLKQRLERLCTERAAALSAHEAERNLKLVIGRLEAFADRVRAGLDTLNWAGRREIIRALVRRIEVDHGQVQVVFRIPGGPNRSDDGAPPSDPRGIGRQPAQVR
ncbi:recombinase zinc beta ribbon domain-containing protein [Methylobacterium sp. UNC300MFChir4.1]|uniref:recombinase zinc beta ribbon domain-containing protein n=1 Tax=Methylobacterium sp. UNC300MFChir4.1 TaxID=1502747 RepID=UPI000C20FFEA|nr:recombinase zinc beta ribbon domain-containing protein [Methylobacterium sp. UNC300MFChir4.1]